MNAKLKENDIGDVLSWGPVAWPLREVDRLADLDSSEMKNNPFDPRLIPQWTKRVKMDMGGRDPLGLSRVSHLITDSLLQGIITTTDRARYYSFFCWAAWHTQQGKPRRYQDFVDGMRRREAVTALATLLHDAETSLAGIEATKDWKSRSEGKDEYSCDFRVLPSSVLGAYSQYYAGSMAELGLILPLSNGTDSVTEEKGELLARLHHEAISKTPYIQKKLYGKLRIPKDVLDNSSVFLSLDALDESFARNERAALIDLMFGREDNPTEGTLRRRQTLALILNTVTQCQRHSIEIRTAEASDPLDLRLVFQPYYYEKLKGDGRRLFSYEYPGNLSECLALWRQFCLHQYFIQALEIILCCVLELIGAEPQGLGLGEVVDRLVTGQFLKRLKTMIGKPCDSPKNLMKGMQIESIPNRSFCYERRKSIGTNHALSEEAILSGGQAEPGVMAADAIVLLAVLYAKWRSASDDKGIRTISEHAGNELWAWTFFNEMDGWLGAADWKDLLRELVRDHILRRHDQTMYLKRRLDSCWLHQHEGRLVKDQDYEPAWRSSRHKSALSILNDLGLLNINQNNVVTITREGQKLLKETASLDVA